MRVRSDRQPPDSRFAAFRSINLDHHLCRPSRLEQPSEIESPSSICSAFARNLEQPARRPRTPNSSRPDVLESQVEKFDDRDPNSSAPHTESRVEQIRGRSVRHPRAIRSVRWRRTTAMAWLTHRFSIAPGCVGEGTRLGARSRLSAAFTEALPYQPPLQFLDFRSGIVGAALATA